MAASNTASTRVAQLSATSRIQSDSLWNDAEGSRVLDVQEVAGVSTELAGFRLTGWSAWRVSGSRESQNQSANPPRRSTRLMFCEMVSPAKKTPSSLRRYSIRKRVIG